MFVRVKVKATGHQVDIIESHFDATKHDRVKRFEPSRFPRRPKYRVRYTKASPKPAEDPQS